jgi:glucan phosphoethanolaminetransferase (alkaline phosphatase superfamily)
VKQLNRRHTFGVFFAVLAVIFVEVINAEAPEFLHMLDDIVIVAASIIAVVVILAMRNRRSLPQLKRTNNILFILAIVFTIFSIFAVIVEAGDPADLGDDIPKIFISLALLANRFL